MGQFREEKNLLLLLGINPQLFGHPGHSLVSILTDYLPPFSMVLREKLAVHQLVKFPTFYKT
jgi:hypothetical protein